MQWMYYNHAMLPTTPPHIETDLSAIKDSSIWKKVHGGGYPLLARWTTDFDCGYETNWYYCIKDTPFILEDLKSSYRYDIRKGRRYFDTQIINPIEHIEEIYNIQFEAFKTYPNEYRPHIDRKKLEKDICTNWKDKIVFGAFEKEDGKMVSYSVFKRHTTYIAWLVLKSVPEYERLKINAAIIAASLEYFNSDIMSGSYIHGGETNISHQTSFQEYLIRTFHFRKAYCKMHIVYRPIVKLIVKMIFPFRTVIAKIPGRLFHDVTSILKMEEMCREQSVRDEYET